MSVRYAVLDVETGGLDPAKNPLIEVGYVLEDGREVEFSLPFFRAACDPVALEINGWGRRPFAAPISPSTAITLLREDLANRLIVSSPAHFDMGFLEAFWRGQTDESPPWGHRSILDLKSYACGVLRVLEPLKNSEIAHRVGVSDTSDHTAMADARFTARVFLALTALQQNDDV